MSKESGISRRTFLSSSAIAAILASLPGYGGGTSSGGSSGPGGKAPRGPDSLPDPSRPAGTVDASLPFDHVVVVMMENHSFDNYLGMLALSGQP